MFSAFDSFILLHQFELNNTEWIEISEKYILSENMMRTLQNKLNWEKIAQYQILSVDFIKEFMNFHLRDYMDLICKYQFLNQDFIREYKHLVNWDEILKCQGLSVDFILEHSEEIKQFRKLNETFSFLNGDNRL